MAGGLFLCFEGMEKVAEKLGKASHSKKDGPGDAPPLDEAARIRGAVRTDFVLSAEIIVITLGTVQSASLLTQGAVLSAVAALMTIGVYGFVAGIVKLDDLGLHWAARGKSPGVRALGRKILVLAPRLIQFLGIAGTLAMFLVGGGILIHGWPALEAAVGHGGAVLSAIAPLLVGGLAGLLALGGVHGFQRLGRLIRRG
jgi:hypothetical protein